MKKKKFALAAVIIALTGAIAVGSAGCDWLVKKPDANFPYDGAVAEGFTGTEAEWLGSGYDAGTREYALYKEAVQEGYRGTYLDFLKELGTVAADDSAAINRALTSVVAIENTYRPTSGTEETLSGSGVIVSLDTDRGDALVVTNYHVVYNVSKRYGKLGIGKNIDVYLYGGTTRPIPAKFYGGAMEYDLALLKITGSEYLKETAENRVYATAASIGDSDSIAVGQRVYALGNPDGEGFSATGGIVSVESEYIDVARADSETQSIRLPEIRTDAAVNHGNSGGGLFNAAGRLVGIVNARSESSGVVAFGYAIPSNFAMSVVQNILDNYDRAEGAVRLARLGVVTKVEDDKGVYDETSGKFFIEEKIVLDSVEIGTAAYSAGLKKGDTLISAALNSASGTTQMNFTRLQQVADLLMKVRLGDTLVLKVSREGKFTDVTARFTESKYFATVV